MIRGMISLALFAGFVYFGLTVNLGSRTLFGHALNIWRAEETQEMVHGVKEKSAPVVDKVARGARAGWREVTSGDTKPAVGTKADDAGNILAPGAAPGGSAPDSAAPDGSAPDSAAPDGSASKPHHAGAPL